MANTNQKRRKGDKDNQPTEQMVWEKGGKPKPDDKLSHETGWRSRLAKKIKL